MTWCRCWFSRDVNATLRRRIEYRSPQDAGRSVRFCAVKISALICSFHLDLVFTDRIFYCSRLSACVQQRIFLLKHIEDRFVVWPTCVPSVKCPHYSCGCFSDRFRYRCNGFNNNTRRGGRSAIMIFHRFHLWRSTSVPWLRGRGTIIPGTGRFRPGFIQIRCSRSNGTWWVFFSKFHSTYRSIVVLQTHDLVLIPRNRNRAQIGFTSFKLIWDLFLFLGGCTWKTFSNVVVTSSICVCLDEFKVYVMKFYVAH